MASEQFISFEEGAEMTRRYRDMMEMKGGLIYKETLDQLLSQDGCIGVRYYYGLTNENRLNLVLVGVDAEGNDLIGEGYLCADRVVPCPDVCGVGNVLNGG